MLIIKLAYRNLMGAGLRTLLTTFVLSIAYIVIIWHSGILEGWNRQARRDMIDWQIGGGEIWHEKYDPYDPFTFQDAHGPIPENFKTPIKEGKLTPILVTSASFYIDGRIQNVLLKGIDTSQTILKIPADSIITDEDVIPVMVGERMKNTILGQHNPDKDISMIDNDSVKVDNNFSKFMNDLLKLLYSIFKDAGESSKAANDITIRWRDSYGTFDAADAKIVHTFETSVPAIDNGQMWLPLERLQQMLQMPDEATYFVMCPGQSQMTAEGWSYKGHDVLLAEMDEIIKRKSVGGSILYTIMLLLAMLAIFDTQVFSIFRRQKEIGTQIALGMTRGQVIGLFTLEGAVHAILAAILAAIYGIPLLWKQAVEGMKLEGTDDYGLAGAELIFPAYNAGLIIATVILVVITTTIVSYWPSRKIAKMNPTDAIRGKLQ